jgi:hypothetical protein
MLDSNLAVMKLTETCNVTFARGSKDSWKEEELMCRKFLNCNVAVTECPYGVEIRRLTLAESVHVRYTDFAKR